MKLSFICPDCSRKLAGVERAKYYTVIAKRTCRGCGERWQIKATPLNSGKQYQIHQGDFTRLSKAQ